MMIGRLFLRERPNPTVGVGAGLSTSGTMVFALMLKVKGMPPQLELLRLFPAP